MIVDVPLRVEVRLCDPLVGDARLVAARVLTGEDRPGRRRGRAVGDTRAEERLEVREARRPDHRLDRVPLRDVRASVRTTGDVDARDHAGEPGERSVRGVHLDEVVVAAAHAEPAHVARCSGLVGPRRARGPRQVAARGGGRRVGGVRRPGDAVVRMRDVSAVGARRLALGHIPVEEGGVLGQVREVGVRPRLGCLIGAVLRLVAPAVRVLPLREGHDRHCRHRDEGDEGDREHEREPALIVEKLDACADLHWSPRIETMSLTVNFSG